MFIRNYIYYTQLQPIKSNTTILWQGERREQPRRYITKGAQFDKKSVFKLGRHLTGGKGGRGNWLDFDGFGDGAEGDSLDRGNDFYATSICFAETALEHWKVWKQKRKRNLVYAKIVLVDHVSDEIHYRLVRELDVRATENEEFYIR